MKKRFIFLSVLLVIFSNWTIAQLKVNSSGTVGVGYTGYFANPKLYIYGEFANLCPGASAY